MLMACALMTLTQAETAVTIYHDFALIRETLPLKLKAGENTINFDRVTAAATESSVMLRDVSGKAKFDILEQAYRNDPLTESFLLSQFEGKTIDFKNTNDKGEAIITAGKIIRSGYQRGEDNTRPIIEVNGKMIFDMPGIPLFPNLGDDSVLHPTLSWQLGSEQDQEFAAELSYLSGGLEWKSDYNVVAPEQGENLDLIGWVSLKNNSGTVFQNSRITLVAGEVNRVEDEVAPIGGPRKMFSKASSAQRDEVTEKSVDDFHFYTLPRPMTLRNKESKQVEFLRAANIQAKKRYVSVLQSSDGVEGGDCAVDSVWEFVNKSENGLGKPMPAGNIRFYRKEGTGGNLVFVGENVIKHTPQGEKIAVKTGSAFDLVVKCKSVSAARESGGLISSEKQVQSYEVTVKNRAKEKKTITLQQRTSEHSKWWIEKNNAPFQKISAGLAEFAVDLEPDAESKVNFTLVTEMK